MKLAVPTGGGSRIPAICRALTAGPTGARCDETALYDLAVAHLAPIGRSQADPPGVVEALA